MTADNQEEKLSLTEKVLEKIKSGQVKMRPKFHFVLKTLLVVGAIIVVAGFILFLVSFISFHLRASGVWYLPGFGPSGLGAYLKLLPWFLIFISLILIVILEILAKRFAFVWRRPVFYSLLAVIFIALIGGLLIDRTPLHPGLFWQARQGKLPLMAPAYREFGAPKFREVQRGIVEELTENGFILKKADDELLTVILSSATQFPFGKEIKDGDSVVVMGEREDSMVRALGVRKIDDEFRVFERRLPRPLMPRMK